MEAICPEGIIHIANNGIGAIQVAMISEMKDLGLGPYELLSINHGVQGSMGP